MGQILEMSDEELKEIRNFGVKSLDELKERLRAIGYGMQEEPAAPDSAEPAEATADPSTEEEAASNG